MKKIIYLFAFLGFLSVHGQNVNLSTYSQGKYHNDTIYSAYRDFGPNGKGYIGIDAVIGLKNVTGMEFKLVIDSVNLGNSPTHTAFYDKNGSWVPVKKGDTLDLNINLKLWDGKLGFHVIHHGTPTIGGENHHCNLELIFTLSDDFGMGIQPSGNPSCTVETANSLRKKKNIKTNVYPNPATFQLNITNPMITSLTQVKVLNIEGKILNLPIKISKGKVNLDSSFLSPGVYNVILQTKNEVSSYKFSVK